MHGTVPKRSMRHKMIERWMIVENSLGGLMKTRLIIDEDSVYEIDEECNEARKEDERREQEKKKERGRRKR